MTKARIYWLGAALALGVASASSYVTYRLYMHWTHAKHFSTRVVSTGGSSPWTYKMPATSGTAQLPSTYKMPAISSTSQLPSTYKLPPTSGTAQQPSTYKLPVLSPEATPAQLAEAFHDVLEESFYRFARGDMDSALFLANMALNFNASSAETYVLRGDIYAHQKHWRESEKDYKMALGIIPDSSLIKFNLAQLKFLQKQYDKARPEFVDLQTDKDFGDIAAYKVFLCDLKSNQPDLAAKDIDAFNQAGMNPSYYFGNVVWSLTHHNTEEARSWLLSASRIYAQQPTRMGSYLVSLQNLGYLPLPPPPQGG